MNNSKLNLIQSISEQQQQAEQLQASLLQLSQTLNNFEQLITLSEKPITDSTMTLSKIDCSIMALESRMSSILSSMMEMSTEDIKTLSASCMSQIELLQTQISSIDMSAISSVTSKIDSFSTSLKDLQTTINRQLQGIKIDQQSLEKSIQNQVNRAIASQSEQIESQIQTLIMEKLNSQRAFYILFGITIFAVLILSISLYLSFQIHTNRGLIEAQQEVIQEKRQQISNQIKVLDSLRR